MTVQVSDANRLLDNARVELAGALDGAIWQAMFNVFSDFANRTNLWYEDIPVVIAGAQAVGSTITVVPSSGSRFNRLLYVLDDGNLQRSMSMPTPGVLMFINAVDNAQTWTARIALCPDDPVPSTGSLKGIPQFPDWILEKYHIGLLAGVVGRMMTQVGKPYTNPTMAKYHLTVYKNAVSEGMNDARRQNLYAAQNWTFPLGFAGRLNP
jgi:hypothetical protein